MRMTRRRLAFTVLAILAILGVFVGKLVNIQVVRAAELNAQSLDKRSIEVVNYGIRGDIVDTNGVVLADSVERYDITVSPRLVADFRRTTDGVKVKVTVADALAELATATGEDVASLQASVGADPESSFAYLSKSATLAELLAVRKLHIPWVWDELHPSRTYPNGAVAGNLIGFIGTDGPQAGLEKAQDACVGSTNGSSVYERGEDGVGIPGSTVTTKAAVNGGTLKLTIDSDFQWYVQQVVAQQAKELGADWATAIVVRVSDAHLMAVVDYPSVDPNNVNGVPVTALGSLAFSTPYEPGSTMKAMTVASLLDAGVITQTTPLNVPGRLEMPHGGYIKDSWAHDNIRYTAAGALSNSSNVGISLLSDTLSASKRHDYMLKFGLNEKTAVHFLGESGGFLREASDWDEITNYAVQFGQGVQTTSAQVASIYQTLGNGGVRLPLTLVEGCEWPDGTVTQLPDTAAVRAVSAKAASQTVQMMENVVTQGWLRSALTIPGYRVAAKTGTAQVSDGVRYTEDRVISIAGLVPAEAPEYAVVVTFGKPDTIKTSGGVAPTFTKIMKQVIKSFRVTPSTEAPPSIPLTW